MKALIFVVLAYVLTGCSSSMTRQETISAVAECEKAGMDAELIWWHNHEIYNVVCLPKKGE